MLTSKIIEDKLNKILCEVYATIGVDFNTVDKSDPEWFLNFSVPKEIQEGIFKKHTNRLKNKIILDAISFRYWLGVSPKFKQD